MSEIPLRIIFVDGDESSRNVAKSVYDKLEEENEEIVLVTCSTGNELLLRCRIIEPDLIIMGQQLIDMDGLSAIQKLRDRPEGKNLPIFFLSEKKNLEMLKEYEKVGVAGILYKPLDTATLYDKVNSLWKEITSKEDEDDTKEIIVQA